MNYLSANVDTSMAGVYAIVIILPPILMALGHWWPWDATLGRPLNEQERRVYGVVGSLLSVMAALMQAETQSLSITASHAIGLTWIAFTSAGIMTIWAYHIDDHNEMRHRLEDEKHRSNALRDDAKSRSE